MADPHKPPLSAEIYEAIALAQHEVDKKYWAELQPFRVPVFSEISELMGGPPTPPKRPFHLFKILREYAYALYDAEASRYPPFSEMSCWLVELRERVEARVIKSVKSGVKDTIFHHATVEEIKRSVHDALVSHVEDCKSSFPQSVDTQVSTMVAENRVEVAGERSSNETIGEQIKRLRDECHSTTEELAEAIEVSTRSVYRHLRDGTRPHPGHLAAYEEYFTAKLKKPVRLYSPRDVKRQ